MLPFPQKTYGTGNLSAHAKQLKNNQILTLGKGVFEEENSPTNDLPSKIPLIVSKTFEFTLQNGLNSFRSELDLLMIPKVCPDIPNRKI